MRLYIRMQFFFAWLIYIFMYTGTQSNCALNGNANDMKLKNEAKYNDNHMLMVEANERPKAHCRCLL